MLWVAFYLCYLLPLFVNQGTAPPMAHATEGTEHLFFSRHPNRRGRFQKVSKGNGGPQDFCHLPYQPIRRRGWRTISHFASISRAICMLDARRLLALRLRKDEMYHPITLRPPPATLPRQSLWP